MVSKSDFSDEEWTLVALGPMLAGFAVTAADPSGLIGAVQESAAMAKSVKQAGDSAGEGSLIGEIAASYQSSEGRTALRDGMKDVVKGRKPQEACDEALARLSAAAAAVAAKAPGDSGAYNGWLRETAQNVAEAAKEGGFMGFGGTPVSEAEHRTLAELDSLLKTQESGTPPPPPMA